MEYLGFQEILLLVIIVAVMLIPVVFFAITLQKTLEAIEPQNRTVQPGKVWFIFIPFFNFVWIFILVKAVAESSQRQFEQYGIFDRQKPAYSIGMAWAICVVCNWIPIIGLLAALAGIVLFIVYWVQVTEIKNQLLMLRNTYRDKDENSIF